jgi:hypothetical protein
MEDTAAASKFLGKDRVRSIYAWNDMRFYSKLFEDYSATLKKGRSIPRHARSRPWHVLASRRVTGVHPQRSTAIFQG